MRGRADRTAEVKANKTFPADQTLQSRTALGHFNLQHPYIPVKNASRARAIT
jgi:hypothetical protein